MRIQNHELQHPTQASRLRLNLYRYDPPSEQGVAGLMPPQAGFLVTEERVGTSTVVKSLGFSADEHEARQLFQRRQQELAQQGWRPPAAPALAPPH
jgi:hypothetical protein